MMKKTKVVARKKKVTPSTISASRKKVMTKKPIRKMEDGGEVTKKRLKQAGMSREEYAKTMADNAKVPMRPAGKVNSSTDYTYDQIQALNSGKVLNTREIGLQRGRGGKRGSDSLAIMMTNRAVSAGVLPEWTKGSNVGNYSSSAKKFMQDNPKVLDEMSDYEKEALKRAGYITSYKRGGKTKTAKKTITPLMKRGGKVTKMKSGGILKNVNPMSNTGLSKLPTEVRNKMGYKKKGGKVVTRKKK